MSILKGALFMTLVTVLLVTFVCLGIWATFTAIDLGHPVYAGIIAVLVIFFTAAATLWLIEISE